MVAINLPADPIERILQKVFADPAICDCDDNGCAITHLAHMMQDPSKDAVIRQNARVFYDQMADWTLDRKAESPRLDEATKEVLLEGFLRMIDRFEYAAHNPTVEAERAHTPYIQRITMATPGIRLQLNLHGCKAIEHYRPQENEALNKEARETVVYGLLGSAIRRSVITARKMGLMGASVKEYFFDPDSLDLHMEIQALDIAMHARP